MRLPTNQFQHLSEGYAHSHLGPDGFWLHPLAHTSAWQSVAQIAAANALLFYCLMNSIRYRLVGNQQRTELPQPAPYTQTHSLKLSILVGMGVTCHLVLKGRTAFKIGLSVGNFKVMLINGKSWWKPQIKVTATGLVKCSTIVKKHPKECSQKVAYKDAFTQSDD
jgi:hypothetical protein